MAITVTWSVMGMKRDTATGGVNEVRWQCVAQADTGEAASEAGKLKLTPDADAADFIAFEDLTEATVIGWVKDALTAEEVTRIEEDRTARVQERVARNATQANGVPWAAAAPTE